MIFHRAAPTHTLSSIKHRTYKLFANKELKKPSFSNRKLIIFAGIFSLVGGYAIYTSFAAGNTYYVATTGLDTNNGTEAAPFKTIQRAIAAVSDNSCDTIIVKDGTYTVTVDDSTFGDINKSGTAGCPLTVKSQNKWGAKLDGQNLAKTGFVVTGGAQYVQIDGFEIYNIADGEVMGDGTPAAGGEGSASGVELYSGGANSVIVNNNIHDIGRHCTNTTNGQVGIFIQKGNVIVEKNIIHDIGRYQPGEAGCSVPSIGYSLDHGIYLNGSGSATNGVTIKNNIFHDTDRGWQIQIYPGTMDSINVVNNTFSYCNSHKNYTCMIIGANLTNTNIKNNIFYNPSGGKTIERYNGTWNMAISNNITSGDAMLDSSVPAGTTLSANQLNTDPLLVNPPIDFHLQSNSPAINAGADLSAEGITSDYEGDTRPQGPSFDIGAYEMAIITANLWVDTNGGTCTRQSTPGAYVDGQACSSFNSALAAATRGDTIKVKAGTYGPQSLTNVPAGSSGYVLIQPADGETVQIGNGGAGNCKGSTSTFWQLCIEGSDWVELRDFNVFNDGSVGAVGVVKTGSGVGTENLILRNISALAVRMQGRVDNIQILGGQYGGDLNDGTFSHVSYLDTAGQFPSNVTFDGVRFYNIQSDNPGDHMECILANAFTNLTLINSRFEMCGQNGQSTANIHFNDDLGASSGYTIRNNFFGNNGGQPEVVINGDIAGTKTFEFNSVDGAVSITDGFGGGAMNVKGNYAAQITCLAGITYEYNITTSSTCTGTDNSQVGSLDFVNSSLSTWDLHLTSTANAIGKVTAGCIPSDIDGDTRPAANCDAGADEVLVSASCDRYASPAGNDTNSGSQASPYRNASKMATSLSAGQTGCFMSGTYPGAVTINQSNISFTTAPSEPDRSAVLTGPTFYINDASNVTFTNLSINGSSAAAVTIQVFGDNFTLSSSDVTNQHNAESCIIIGEYEGSFAKVVSNTLIDGNVIHDCGKMANGNHDHGIYVASARDTVITNNIIYGVQGGWGIQLWADAHRTEIARNILDGNHNGNIIIAGGNYSALGPSSDNIIHSNILSNPVNRYNIESYWEGSACTNNSVTDNCVWNAPSGNFYPGSGYSQSNNTNADPLYVNRSAKNFNLLGSSPCASILAGNTTPPDTTAPTTPSGLNSPSKTTTTINLAWNASTDTGGSGLAGYRLYRSTSAGGTYSLLTSTTGLSYTNTGLTAGTTYYYKITAYDNSANESAQTTALSVATNTNPAPPPPTPTKLGDLNSDNTVNIFDLSILLSHYGGNGTGDLNSSGSVDVIDLSILLSRYGG